jgi:hypothetical protein
MILNEDATVHGRPRNTEPPTKHTNQPHDDPCALHDVEGLL